MKKIRFFRQHTPETCGISCMLMIMNYFGVDYPTIGKEQRLYRLYGTKATPGTLGAAIAYALSARGLRVTLAHSSEQLIENHDSYYPEPLYTEILNEYDFYIRKGMDRFELRAGVQIDCNVLRCELAAERLVILQCLVDGSADGMHDQVLHGILLYDCDAEGFFACDPAYGKVYLTNAEIETHMETPVGRMYIAAGQDIKG